MPAARRGGPRPGAAWWTVALGLAALVLAGCSDASRPSPAPGTTPFAPENPTRPPTPEAWLDRVCTALRPVVPGARAPAVDPADPRGTRQRWVAYLESRARALTRAADEIVAAGAAPVPGGVQVTRPVVELLRGRAEVAERSVEALRAIPEVATGTMIRAVQEARSRTPLAGSGAVLRDTALTPALTRVAAGVPSCRAVSPPP